MKLGQKHPNKGGHAQQSKGLVNVFNEGNLPIEKDTQIAISVTAQQVDENGDPIASVDPIAMNSDSFSLEMTTESLLTLILACSSLMSIRGYNE